MLLIPFNSEHNCSFSDASSASNNRIANSFNCPSAVDSATVSFNVYYFIIYIVFGLHKKVSLKVSYAFSFELSCWTNIQRCS